MENSPEKKTIPSYAWLALAVLGTVLISCLPYLHLPVPAADFESEELYGAFQILTDFVLQALLIVPLLCVVPALWSRAAWRLRPVVIAALVLVAFVTGYACTGSVQDGLYAILFIAPAGAVIHLMQRAGYSNFRVVFYGSILMLAGLFARICLPALIDSGDAFLPLRNLAAAYETEWNFMAQSIVGGDESRVESAMAFSDMLKQMRVYPEISTLEILYYPAALAGLSNGLLSHLFNRDGSAQLAKLPPFENWLVDPAYFYGSLALTILSYIVTMMGASYGMGLMQVAYVIWLLPMSLAGLSAVKYWTKRRPWVFIVACILTGLMFSVFAQILAVFGMLRFIQQRMKRRMQGEDR